MDLMAARPFDGPLPPYRPADAYPRGTTARLGFRRQDAAFMTRCRRAVTLGERHETRNTTGRRRALRSGHSRPGETGVARMTRLHDATAHACQAVFKHHAPASNRAGPGARRRPHD